MAKKITKKLRYTCRDCAHCSDWHNKSPKGEFIFGKCRIIGYSVLLNHDYCKEFKKNLQNQ